jgi:phosphatidate cytidylyltransferase
VSGNTPPVPGRFDRSELRSRLITGFAAAILVVGAILISRWGLLAITVAISMLGLAEFYRLGGLQLRTAAVQLWLVIAAGIWVLLAATVEGISMLRILLESAQYLPLLLLLLPLSLVLLLFSRSKVRSFEALGLLTLGLGYVALPFWLLYLSSAVGASAFSPAPSPYLRWAIPLGILTLVWAADIAAYFAGKAYGRRKLMPHISPGKTWEGFAGGTLGCLVLATLWQLLGPKVPFNWWVVAGIVAVFSVLGDLVESQLKRTLGVKDSGGLLPGHGGLLDRFDGFLLAMPVVYTYLLLVR